MISGYAFCENEKCDIILFRSDLSDPPVNCPSCGQFGRLKNQEPEPKRTYMHEPTDDPI